MTIYIMAVVTIALFVASMVLCSVTEWLKARVEQMNKKLQEL